jgi:hypothetical protein
MTEKSRSNFWTLETWIPPIFIKLKHEKKHYMNIYNLIFNNKQILISLKIKYQIK